jgi:predicted anti-sigma-YlaC factor YlaD
VDCDTWREELSAIADGEDSGVDRRLLDAHLARCAGCLAFRRDAHAVRRAFAVAEAEPMPDLARRVTRLDRVADRASRWGLLRLLLGVVAVQVIVLSLPALVLGEEPDTSAHGARHLGAFSVAFGAALLLVVWRPARARSILPVGATLAGALVITAVVDVAEGRVPLLGEAVHVPEVIGVVLVWLLAVPAPRRRRPGGALPRARFGPLRAVADRPDEPGEAGAGAG